jgi:hypothetical protein
LDFNAEGATTTKVYHGLAIVVNSSIIGRITSFNPSGSFTRDLVHQYELNPKTFGHPVDIVPGKATGFNVSLARAEVWGQELEKVFGFTDVFSSLCDQTRPFKILEVLHKGNEVYSQYEYRGCWFSSKNLDEMGVDGDGIIKISAEIMYVNRVRLT